MVEMRDFWRYKSWFPKKQSLRQCFCLIGRCRAAKVRGKKPEREKAGRHRVVL